MYRLYIKNNLTGEVTELPFASMSATEELNRGQDARFSLDWVAIAEIVGAYGSDPMSALTGSLREIYIEKDGAKIYDGVISNCNIYKSDDGGIKIDLASVGIFDLFGKRRTGAKRVFTSTDAGEIAWTWINESQTADGAYSDLGVTMGTIMTSVDRDRTSRFANIKDEIIQMSNEHLLNGYDFEIDNTKKFNVYYPQKGTQRPTIVFDDSNMNWSFYKPLVTVLCNKVHVLGQGFDDALLYATRTSVDSYKTAFGVLEDVLAERDVIVAQTLNDKGDRYLLDHQSPITSIQIDHIDGRPAIGDYSVGDSVKVDISELGVNGEYRRIYKRTISIDNPGLGNVSLSLK